MVAYRGVQRDGGARRVHLLPHDHHFVRGEGQPLPGEGVSAGHGLRGRRLLQSHTWRKLVVQGDHGGQRLHFDDIIFGVPQFYPTALQFLPHLQLPSIMNQTGLGRYF